MVKDVFTTHKVEFKTHELDLSQDKVQRSFIEYVGKTTLPQAYIDGINRGDATDMLAAWENGKFYKWLDRAKIKYDPDQSVPSNRLDIGPFENQDNNVSQKVATGFGKVKLEQI